MTSNDVDTTTIMRKSFQPTDYRMLGQFRQDENNENKLSSAGTTYFHHIPSNNTNNNNNGQNNQQKFGLLISKHQPATKSLTNTSISNPYTYTTTPAATAAINSNNFLYNNPNNVSNNDLNVLFEYEKNSFFSSLKTLFAIFDSDCKVYED